MSSVTTDNELGRGKLSLAGVIAQSLGFIGPVFGAAFLLPTIAGLNNSATGAGVQAPLAVIIALIGLLGVAWIASRYAKRHHHAGAIYEYVGQGWGRKAGFVSGWVYYLGTLTLSAALFPVLGDFFHDTFKARLGLDLPWLAWSLIGVAIVIGMVVLGVELSMKFQLFVTGLSMLVIAAWGLWVIVKGDPAGHSFAPLNPGADGFTLKGIAFGLVYGCLIFTGWETAGNLAEESDDPGRNVPRAMIGSLLVVGVFFTITMFALVADSGFDISKLSPAGILAATAGDANGGAFFGKLVGWIVMIDVLAVSLGVATATVRGFFAMARDGGLPSALGKVNPTRKTPVNAALVVAGVCVAILLWLKASDGIVSHAPPEAGLTPRFEIFAFLAGVGGLCLVLVYIAVSLLGFKGMPGEDRNKMAIAGALGVLASGAAVFGTLYKAPDFMALDRVWFFTLLIVLTGVAAMLYLNSRGKLGKSA